MLKRVYRLPASVKFSGAKTLHSPIVMMKVSATSLSFNRFGFTISKKVAKSAVDRNRTKRKIRACIETLFSQLRPGHDVLFIIRKNISDDYDQSLYDEMKGLLFKGGLL